MASDRDRVVFLDIDGVLNSHAFFKAGSGRPPATDTDEQARRMIDPAAVEHLNALVEKSGASLVISSSWRRIYSLGAIGRALRANGFEHPRAIIGATPPLGGPRGHEIQAWIDSAGKPLPTFVILDDDSDMEHLADRLVQTHYTSGLLAEHVDAALRLLGACA